MEQIGYGIMKDGKPSGIWPRPWTSAMRRAKYEKSYTQPPNRIKVVPVYIGSPIEVITPVEGTEHA